MLHVDFAVKKQVFDMSVDFVAFGFVHNVLQIILVLALEPKFSPELELLEIAVSVLVSAHLAQHLRETNACCGKDMKAVALVRRVSAKLLATLTCSRRCATLVLARWTSRRCAMQLLARL